jgi:hypothetical protein
MSLRKEGILQHRIKYFQLTRDFWISEKLKFHNKLLCCVETWRPIQF